MTFFIDFTKYELIDLSLEVKPNQPNPERPFEVREGRLGDGTHKFDIVNTHTHVGTHVESPWHFYGRGKTCTDYPLQKFMGQAALLRVNETDGDWATLESVRKQLEPRRGTFTILFIRNDTGKPLVRFRMDCVPYFAGLGIDLLVFETTFAFGDKPEDGRTFHDVLMSRDILLVEFPANAQALSRDDFYVFAVPLKIAGLDSSACRLFAVVEKA